MCVSVPTDIVAPALSGFRGNTIEWLGPGNPLAVSRRKPPQNLPVQYAYIRVYPYIIYSLQDIIITTTLGHLVTPWERRGLPVCASNKMYNKCVCTPLVFAPIVRVLYCVVILLLYIIWPPHGDNNNRAPAAAKHVVVRRRRPSPLPQPPTRATGRTFIKKKKKKRTLIHYIYYKPYTINNIITHICV